ncbi:DUF924 family protein [Kingella negevensis]|uniref:DUF924 family protein n=1 Tax=Kingella negevensis TaxID=1522312 RepID=UPI00050A2AFD|nr:DUF924 family protein [Kingella negevensis]MDK4689382.1 DUF924 domain-containing protein [Kingella negevensis]WII90474.1 DUF924 domain-containing protein [Kingella negevensis]
MEAQQILDFWFDESVKPNWFKHDADFDDLVRTNFEDVWKAAIAGELFEWRETMYGRLAEIIVLDQFSRNLFRNSARAYTQDGMALILAQEIVKDEEFKFMVAEYKQFAILPFMHSESLKVHEQATRLFAKYTSAGTLEFALRHKAVLERFGRYPHRNQALGRKNTSEETAFLKDNPRGF